VVGTPPAIAVNGSAGTINVSANAPLAVSVTNGTGNVYDWVGFFQKGATNGFAWWYMNGGQSVPTAPLTSASFTATAPITPGEYEFRFFADTSGSASLIRSVSATIVVIPPAITVNGTTSSVTVASGAPLSVAVANGHGNLLDWIGFFVVNATNGFNWWYMNGSQATPTTPLTSASVNTNAPTAPGQYEFRYLAAPSGGFGVAKATSASIVVTPTTMPVIDPPTGTYGVAQTVTMTVSGTPSVIRYTTNGAEPTTTSAAYTAPFSVSTGTMLKARAFPINGWAASGTSVAELAFNYGQLALPAASASGGTYADPQSIALSAVAGAIIRYTIDGTDPTPVSNQYVSPIAISSGTVELRARAFHPDWSASASLAQTYTIDAVAPTITSSRFPAALNSWHNSPTTVTFACADNVGVDTCSSPSTFVSEGQGQTVVGTAIDEAGRQATLNVTVNVDLTAPDATITSPAGMTTTSGTSIALVGEASDQLSGLSSVTCNGQAATIAGGDVSCNVPLNPGINDIVLVARDVAGNSTSAGVRIVRTGTSTVLGLAPAMQTIEVEEELTLKLTDDFGAAITGATWTSSAPAIVSLSVDDPPVLVGLTPGTATITATKNGLNAVATLIVAAGPLPSGTMRWAVGGLFDGVSKVLHANRVDLDVPDLFIIEPSGNDSIVRGVTARGDVKWVTKAPGYPIMADSFGGVVAGTQPQISNAQDWGDPFETRYGALTRFAGPPAASPWRYDSVGRLERPAQASDGTIYALEKYDTGLTDVHGIHIIETQAIVLDGATGRLLSRIPLQREIQGYGCGNDGWNLAPSTVGPVVGNDGYGYVLVRNVTNVRSGGCGMTSNVSQDVGVKLLRISPAGDSSYTVIFARHCDHGFSTSFTICDEEPNLGQLVPDGIGGVLVTYAYMIDRYPDGNGVMTNWFEGRMARITTQGIQYDTLSDGSVIKMTTNNGRAFVSDTTSSRAVDVTNLATVWSTPSPMSPVATMANGRFAMHDVAAGTLTEFAADGAPIQSAEFGGGYQAGLGLFTKIENVGSTAMLTSRVSLRLDEEFDSYHAGGGSSSQQNSPRIPQGRTPYQEATAMILMDHLLVAPPQYVAGNRIEHGGMICREPGGQQYYYLYLGPGNNWSGPAAEMSSCKSATAVGYAHSHPSTDAVASLPSGYSSNAQYLDARSDISGAQPSDLKIADDFFDDPLYGPDSVRHSFTWYLTAPFRNPFYVKYKKTSVSPAKDNISVYDNSLRLWQSRPALW
jgi:hypothetical protein